MEEAPGERVLGVQPVEANNVSPDEIESGLRGWETDYPKECWDGCSSPHWKNGSGSHSGDFGDHSHLH